MKPKDLKALKKLQTQNLIDKYRALFLNLYDLEGTDVEYGMKDYLFKLILDGTQVAAYKLNTSKQADSLLGFGNYTAEGLNWMNRPVYARPIPLNNSKLIPTSSLKVDKDIVLLKLDINLQKYIYEYVSTIIDLKSTIRTNVQLHKIPFVLQSTNVKAITAIEQLMDDEALVYADALNITSLQTNAPYLIDKLHEHVNEVEAELLTILGIDNVKFEKAAQMGVDEINSNNEEINAYRQMITAPLKAFFKKIKEVLGFDIKLVEKTQPSHSNKENPKGDEEDDSNEIL